MQKTTKKINLNQLVITALLSALAYLSLFVTPIHVANFLTLDMKDAIMTIGALLYGPVTGAAMALITSTLELLTISGTGFYGWIMNFVSSAVFCCAAGIIYKYRRSMSGAVIGLSVSVVSMTAVMMVMNLLITPLYTGMPRSAIVDMIPTLLLPFNLLKGILNAGIALLLYKPLSTALHKTNLSATNVQNHKPQSLKNTIIVTLAAVVLIVASVLLLLWLSAQH